MAANVSYDYGLRSPEWFSQFCGDAYYVEGVNPDAYVEKDYESAKNNIILMMDDLGFLEDDRITVLLFFEENWNAFAKEKSCLAAIPTYRFSEEAKKRNEESYLQESPTPEELFNKLSGENLCGGDDKTTEKIDTTNAVYIELPDLLEMKKKIEQLSENEDDNQMDI